MFKKLGKSYAPTCVGSPLNLLLFCFLNRSVCGKYVRSFSMAAVLLQRITLLAFGCQHFKLSDFEMMIPDNIENIPQSCECVDNI